MLFVREDAPCLSAANNKWQSKVIPGTAAVGHKHKSGDKYGLNPLLLLMKLLCFSCCSTSSLVGLVVVAILLLLLRERDALRDCWVAYDRATVLIMNLARDRRSA